MLNNSDPTIDHFGVFVTISAKELRDGGRRWGGGFLGFGLSRFHILSALFLIFAFSFFELLFLQFFKDQHIFFYQMKNL